jgi:hypothetical protein
MAAKMQHDFSLQSNNVREIHEFEMDAYILRKERGLGPAMLCFLNSKPT